MELRPEYTLLAGAVADAIEKLENCSVYNAPEVEECIDMLKESLRAAEEINISAVYEK